MWRKKGWLLGTNPHTLLGISTAWTNQDCPSANIGRGEGADIYILDSGINYHHNVYTRAKFAGYDPMDNYYRN